MEAKKQPPLSYPLYYNTVFFFCLAGIADSIYLAVSHLKNYTDITYSSFCALSKAINCDTVSQSSWSIFFGIPVAYWGITGYLLFLLLLIPLRKNNDATTPLWSILVLLSAFFAIASIFLGYISATKIHAYCIMCLLSYGLSFSLFYCSWLIRRRFDNNTFFVSVKKSGHYLLHNRQLVTALIILSIVTFGLKTSLPSYWEFEISPLDDNISHGITEDGHPWIGAKKPSIIIKEFADYQCFQCYKMHFLLRRLINEHPGKIRLIHYQYPMDHQFNSTVVPEPFHVGSGKMALLAIYASTQNKFWVTNDILYQFGRSKKPFKTTKLADATGLSPEGLALAVNNQQIRLLLRNDIRTGGMAGITGTPSYIINGKTYEGSIPSKILQEGLQ